ncbi:MAG: PIN domain-containing protein [Nitrospirae bacterium]|nr:PIN domain-containing protein [Nitrospirota bacterium]
MKVLFDTNIVLDLLMDRRPFSDAAVLLFSKVEDGTLIGFLCGTTITTVYYLASKALGAAQAQEEVRKILGLFEVAPVNRPVLESALAAGFIDFEDAVLYEAACHVGADAIVTRNQKDFKNSKISVYTSTELARIMSVQNQA